MPRVQLVRTISFSAAHRVPTSPNESARRLHGHDFHVEIVLAGEPDPQTGWLVDFGEVRRVVAPLIEQLDHSYLNEIEGLSVPSCPAIAQWILDRLKLALPQLERVNVQPRGDLQFVSRQLPEDKSLGLPLRLGFSLESAHRLPRCGESHKCAALHGHSFRVEVGAADLDRLVPHLRRIYDRLDHRFLNEIDGLDNPTSENLAAWIWRALRESVNDLNVVVVRESSECFCIYRGEK